MASSNKDLADFPDVEAKLQKPSKQSAFEKQKAEAEAKRKREAAETAAVYESFVKSFDNEDDEGDAGAFAGRGDRGFSRQQAAASFGRPGPGGINAAFGGASRRHFGAGSSTGLKSGPGSLGPPPTGFGKKRGFDTYQQGHRDTARGRLGFHDDENEGASSAPPNPVLKVFDTSDDESDARLRDLAEEKAIAKPTLRLANLPPGASPAFIKTLMPANITVENVKIIPPTNSTGSERKSMAAIVTLSKETPATDIDGAVSSLQNKYLGYGFYLSLHRHLSSAVASATVASSLTSLNATSHAFGAKPVPQTTDNNNNYHHGGYRGFAPPTSYNTGGGPLQKTILHVPVTAPKDIKQLQLIHKVVESVLEHGPEFEALLMSRPNVQKEEKWAWLYDGRSEGGVWYRWRLWEIITGAQAKGGRQGKYLPLFERSHAWKMPEKGLAYEYTTAIDEFVSDSEYNSSDEEDYDDEPQKPAEGADNEHLYLNPLDKAKLTHLLARLPTTLARIRKGDIARVTSFAITHASRGADEIVDMIVSNIAKPFALTSANPHYKRSDRNSGAQDGESHNSTPLPEDITKPNEAQDSSPASLVGLYVVSDILSSSATSTVRHAWRYRQLFEASLKQRKTFEMLGLIPERHGWGRMRAEKWKRSVGLVIGLWEGWCAFPHESQQLFLQTFENPPSAKKEEQTEAGLKKSKWKTVEAGSGAQQGSGDRSFLQPLSAPAGAAADYNNSHEDGEPMGDVDGDAMDEDMADVDYDSDIDGVPMDDEEEQIGEPMDEDGDGDPPTTSSEMVADQRKDTENPTGFGNGKRSGQQQDPSRRRLRAVDMFADSDGSDDNK
ncbi:hypothetical protein SLS62_004485 [Diatrype stigma]|uniref:CID domain-containing protein n=1 Tax=Diatrype stigma TaxID=117547 RepID=A0AAN9UUQ5_9PEZI